MMKYRWYAIQHRRQLSLLISEDEAYKMIRHHKKYGFTRIHDYDGKIYDVFRATRFQRLLIFLNLIFVNIRICWNTNVKHFVIRRFKPKGRHFIFMSFMPGQEHTAWYGYYHVK